jgi:hypothetical protein
MSSGCCTVLHGVARCRTVSQVSQGSQGRRAAHVPPTHTFTDESCRLSARIHRAQRTFRRKVQGKLEPGCTVPRSPLPTCHVIRCPGKNSGCRRQAAATLRHRDTARPLRHRATPATPCTVIRGEGMTWHDGDVARDDVTTDWCTLKTRSGWPDDFWVHQSVVTWHASDVARR